MVRTGTPATTVLGATFFVMTAPSPRCACREAVRLGERSELRSVSTDRRSLLKAVARVAPQGPAPSGSPTSNARSFAKQSRKRVRGLQQDRVADRGVKAAPPRRNIPRSSVATERRRRLNAGVRLHALAQLAYEGIMDDLAAGGGAATNAAPASAKGQRYNTSVLWHLPLIGWRNKITLIHNNYLYGQECRLVPFLQ